MHIAFDAKRAYYNGTGLGNYSRYTINALCSSYPENRYSLYTPGKDDDLFAAPENVKVITPGKGWKSGLKSYWRSYGISHILAKHKVDLYHGLSNELPFGIDRKPVKSIVTVHDLIFMAEPQLYRPLDRRIYQKKVSYAIKAADRIIAISEQTKRDLVELLHADERKIRVVFQGCHPWFYNEINAEEAHATRERYMLPEKYLLYVGTIEKRKNLLEIIQSLHENDIDIPLVAVGGKTPYYNQIQDYMDRNKLENIRFYHHIDNHDLPAIYQQAEAFIYPSSYEGFGIPVLEALNSGTPVITSRGGCLEETAGKGGLLVDPYDHKELGEAIKSVLENKELRMKLIKEGKKHALKFREEKTIPALYQVYKDAIS